MNSRSSQRGAALFAALCCLAIATAMTAAFYEGIHRAFQQQQRERWHLEAVYLAEAGVDKAIAALAAHPSDYAGEQDTPLGSQADRVRVFSVKVQQGTSPGTFVIQATGSVRGDPVVFGTAGIEATVARDAARLRVTHWKETPR